ncbi:MAG: glucose-6-phosphate dehydrogenase (NADP(+)) [Candidatus Pacebacteria bacterium]|nr:glucose-6-phosphate dehydrogenase (NADP(+)) [Candidatus Paceibacterota bacterium]MCF7863063.1 glucose-6-phosphate dehydrogenase (NADP(+)) [Candidatus Paceibacterota bacterium]
MKTDEPTVLVIFGISGDLSKRSLLPAIADIAEAKVLPDKFKVIGITRQKDFNIEEAIKSIQNNSFLKENIEIFSMDVNNFDEYNLLKNKVLNIKDSFGEEAQYIFYLSVPPEACGVIIENLGKVGFQNSKLLLEKPFGTDLKSAEELSLHIKNHFPSENVYRIDHYLAKETAQNIIVFRTGNSLFKKTWNKDFIEKIEIIVSEQIGIEGRANFYEQTGALRDFTQSHLLQLSALILMNLPENEEYEKVPDLRLEALKNLYISDIQKVKRGQYEGYQNEVQNPTSGVETFMSLELFSKDPNWKDVPILLKTGKNMSEKFTQIIISYKKNKEAESNKLSLCLQPKEAIEFDIWTKKPGFDHQKEFKALSFAFKEHYGKLPKAYEQVIWSAVKGDRSLFAGGKEILESWRILDPVQQKWKERKDDLFIYPKGQDIRLL